MTKIIKAISQVMMLISYNLYAQTTEYLFTKRKELENKILESRINGDFQESIYYLRQLADTDKDTFLIAARAYRTMAIIYEYNLEDTAREKIASEMELYLVDKSIEKYPNNIDSYIYKLNQYKFSDKKEGEADFIKVCQSKFGNRWEMNFVLGYHYIYNDFLWPKAPEFKVSSNYFKKVIELNPSDFNTLLLLSVAYQDNKQLRENYLRKLYQINPEQFEKNQSENNKEFPYIIKSVESTLLGKDLFVYLTSKECQMLKLID